MTRNRAKTDPLHIAGQEVLTISEITARIKEAMECKFSDLHVQGEISQYTRAASGHIYMTLKDDRAVLKAIIWRSVVRRIQFELEEGLEVVCRGSIDVYPPRGNYQLIIRDMHPCGMGALQLAFRQLVRRLEKKGLFDKAHKKPIPHYPEKIGVITSASGAAVRDMIRIIKRRWPIADIYLLPSPVQGKGAAVRISEAINLLNEKRPDLDVIIIGRGGGSLEDLWAFNEECVAMAIFHSNIPIISAVGHAVDLSVSDLVADLHAATPSEAGENTVPDRLQLLAGTGQLARRLGQALLGNVKTGRQRLLSIANRHVIRHPETLLQDKIQRTDELLENMETTISQRIERQKQHVESLTGRLEALNPMKVLRRGYSITFGPEGRPLQDAQHIEVGDKMETRLRNGHVSSVVKETAD